MPTVEARLKVLEKRLQQVEDELAITKLIMRYGFAVDSGDADGTAALYTEDTEVYVDNRLSMAGRKGVRGMVLGESHQKMLPNCSHTMTPFVIDVNGNKAVATGSVRVFWQQNDSINIWRLSANRWELVKRNGRWQVAKRWSTRLGSAEYQKLLHRGLEDSKR